MADVPGEPMQFGEPAPVPNSLPSMHDLVMQDMSARKQFGFDKYKALLQPFNGRDPLKDLYEEILDAAVYIRQALYERDNPAAKPNKGEAVERFHAERAAQHWCHCGPDRTGHAWGKGMRCGRHVQMATTPPDKQYPPGLWEPQDGQYPADQHTAAAQMVGKVPDEVTQKVNCYCGGPEEIYPHAFGTRRYCREQVERGTQAPPR